MDERASDASSYHCKGGPLWSPWEWSSWNLLSLVQINVPASSADREIGPLSRAYIGAPEVVVDLTGTGRGVEVKR
jgi:hypothetical protein